MPQLTAYLAEEVQAQPRYQQRGTETDWLPYTELECRSGKILATDPLFAPNPEEGVLVECRPGVYSVEAKVIDYGGDRRISALRAVQKGSSPESAEVKGTVAVDLAIVGICDYEPYAQAADDDTEAFEKLFEEPLDNEGITGILHLETPEKPPFIYVASGFGDGNYPVAAMKQMGEVVGVEITFIEPAKPYPFRDESHANDESSDDGERSTQGKSADLVFEAFAEVLNSFQRTGDKATDKEQLKNLFEVQNKKFEKTLREEVQKYWEYVVDVRKSAPKVKLTIQETPNPQLSAQESSYLQDLVKEGFTIGATYVSNIPNTRFTLAIGKEEKILAEVYSGARGVSLILHLLYPDQRSLSVDNGPLTPGIPNPDWVEGRKMNSASLGDLLNALTNEEKAAAESWDFQKAAQFQTDYFRRTQQWRAERGGWTMAEIQQQNPALLTGPDEQARTVLEEIRTKWLVAWLQMKPDFEELSDEFLKALVVIHEGHDSELLLNNWMASTLMFKLREHHFTEADSDPLKAFAIVNRENGSPLRLLAQKTTGFRADFYMPVGR